MDKFKFCIWLVDTLLRRAHSFEEIQNKWAYSANNTNLKFLTERSFNRYRRETEQLFEVQIQYVKLLGKYNILNSDNIQENKLLSWILASYRLGNISAEIKKKQVVQLEGPAPRSEFLPLILEAIESKSILIFDYKSHYKESEHIQFYPVFVRLSQQRWYVIGWNLKKKAVRVYAFERMKDVNIEKYDGKSILHNINQKEFFAYSYGVLNDEEPNLVKIRAFWPQNLYLKDVPLHNSQEVVEENDDYTDFELYVRPTYDFIQALLAQREQIKVLEPISLKNKMKRIILKMLCHYEEKK